MKGKIYNGVCILIMEFNHNRAIHYDKLFWAKDEGYLEAIVEAADFKKGDLVLDVGTGTGIVARKIKPLVKEMFALDISNAMLKQGKWEGISLINWDIRDTLFAPDTFDKITARMVFHHITSGLELAIRQCQDMLKLNGILIVAEGIPPSDDPEIIRWYTDMFKLKEDRITFTKDDLVKRLSDNGFNEIIAYDYITRGFSVRNWLVNSDIDAERLNIIMDLHYSASQRVKLAYNMCFTPDDCSIDTKSVILAARKC